MKKAGLILVLFSVSLQLLAQPAERRISRDQYINMWKDEAVFHMNKYGIPASITLAQGILESANGNSALAKYANNHFGIKCHGWDGPGFTADDDKKNECFRKYENASESYRDHSIFLQKKRYAECFTYKTTEYKKWAKGLKKAGYATNPKYAYLLIDLIEQHQLYKFDVVAGKAAKPQIVKLEPKENDEKEIVYTVGHKIKFKDNGVRFVIATSGDTFYKISKEFNLTLSQLYKFNDLSKNDVLQINDVIYVEPKRNKSKTDFHTVVKGEDMREISQTYGIKLKKLLKKNNMKASDKIKAGDKIYLRSRRRD